MLKALHLSCLFLCLCAASALTFPCASSSTRDPPTRALAPVFPTQSVPNPGFMVLGHWSEKAILARPRLPTPSADPVQSICPHEQEGLKNWHDPRSWPSGRVPTSGAVNIPPNTKMLISSCSVNPATVFGLITVPRGSELIFSDAEIVIGATGFQVDGSLLIGSPTCRLRSEITITLHGSRNAQSLPAAPNVKGISVTGRIDVHGVQYVPTWTRLARTANAGASVIYVQDRLNWQPGQTIVITTTEKKDSRDWHRNEERQIVAVYLVEGAPTAGAIRLSSPLSYKHYALSEYQAEVALLSRNILIQGDRQNSEPRDLTPAVCNDAKTPGSTYPCPNSYTTGFGAHVFMSTPTVVGRFSGVEFYRVGQTNVLGRYPIHYHMVGDTDGASQASVTDCSVHRSYFRCVAIHGTHRVFVSQNTAYDAIGHCYFLEDGVEENNTLSYNFGAFVHPIGPFYEISQNLNGQNNYGQKAAEYTETPNLIHPSDLAAGVFYLTNPYNTILGNAASGGWTGYLFPNIQKPLRLSRDLPNFVPMNRPLLQFKGNSAHSTGYWWNSAAAVYVGGKLYENNNGKLVYTHGRSDLSRDSCNISLPFTERCPEKNKVWMRFEDTKIFLANRGIQNWGRREEVIRFEGHDLILSANVFGDVWVDDMLHNCRSNNELVLFNGCKTKATTSIPWGECNTRDYDFHRTMIGFQFYDIAMHHIITNSKFRNCNPKTYKQCVSCSSRVFELLTHSDQFVPGIMQTTRNIQYENVDTNNLWSFTVKLPKDSVSGRLQSWLDLDGTASGGNSKRKTLLGSSRSNEWYKLNDECLPQPKSEMWVCPVSAGDATASFKVVYDENGMQAQVGKTICPNGGSEACPIVGEVIHFGRARKSGLNVGANSIVTGPIIAASGGWFLEFKSGTPALLKFTATTIPGNAPLVVAIPYPSGTTFTSIKAVAASWCRTAWGVCEHVFRPVTSVAAVRNSAGDKYFWDASAGILYVKIVQVPDEGNFKNIIKDGVWNFPEYHINAFERAGIEMPGNTISMSLQIQARCGQNGLYCPYVSRRIPAAVGCNTCFTQPRAAATSDEENSDNFDEVFDESAGNSATSDEIYSNTGLAKFQNLPQPFVFAAICAGVAVLSAIIIIIVIIIVVKSRKLEERV